MINSRPRRRSGIVADVDIVVIGGGPAGLAAAHHARKRGRTVHLLEAADSTGGQYWRHLPPQRARGDDAGQHGWADYVALRDRLEADAGCTILTGAQVWAIEPRPAPAAAAPVTAAPVTAAPVAVTDEPPVRLRVGLGPADARRDQLVLDPAALVLATGAHDRTLPLPGWTLPGVFTAGAAQAFAKGERVAVGERVVISGSGPFLLPVAESLSRVGARVLGVYEAAGLRQLVRGWGARPWQLLRTGAKLGELTGYVRHQVRDRIPYRIGSQVTRIHGDRRVEAVTISAVDADWAPIVGSERVVRCDAVALGHGFVPRLELPIAAGCAIGADRFVTVDDQQQTSVCGVYAAGEVTGIGGVDLASAEGAIAGWCAAGGTADDPAVALPVRRRRAFAGFARRLTAAHGVRPGWVGWLTDETLVCRCEEVDHGRLRSVREATGATGLRSLKLSTRAGLGLCQGRICGRTVEDLLRPEGGGFADGVSTDRRPIASPVRLGDLIREPERPQ